MARLTVMATGAAVAAALLAACGGSSGSVDRGAEEADALFAKQLPDGGMTLTSVNFTDGQELPARFTCDSSGISPALEIAGIPDGAKSLALVMDDPGAEGGTYVHWIVAGLPPQDTRFVEQAVPDGADQARNSAGRAAYGPACPPEGGPAHTYRISAYALDADVGGDIRNDPASDALETITEHATARVTLQVTYERSA